MGHDHTNHMWMMVIACGGALLLILVLPLFGLSKNWSVGISIAIMAGLHLWMMRGHSNHSNQKTQGGNKVNCCQNNSSNNEIAEEKKKVSWKIILVAVIIIGLLVVSSLGLMFH